MAWRGVAARRGAARRSVSRPVRLSRVGSGRAGVGRGVVCGMWRGLHSFRASLITPQRVALPFKDRFMLVSSK